jgi:hypothetical protein
MESNRIEDGSEQPTTNLRGLDQVSHLFLSHVAERAVRARSQNESEKPANAPQEGLPAAVVLRASQQVTREHLLWVLRDQPAALEEGMRLIDANLPCETPGNIELLALDTTNQLAVIDFDDKPNDSLLLRGMAHLDWVVSSMPLLRRMYQGQVINFTLQPRLFLVAPDFSPLFRSAVHQVRSLQIQCVKYHAVDLKGGAGIFCERMTF